MRAARACLALALACAACSSPRGFDQARARLGTGLSALEAGDERAVDREACAVLAATQDDPRAHALQRFFAAWLLAQAHARAAEGAPFLEESTSARGAIGPIGRREAEPDRRPAPDAHRVASVYHASQARALYGAAARSGPTREGTSLVPDALWDFGVDAADANLQILLATTYHRLGFRSEVAKTLARSPELLELARALETLERYRVPAALRPWSCAMVFDHLRATNEEEAYRFAVAAIEGGERFGHALPAPEVARLEDWILHGASVQFVDPRSQTPYLPGATRSPISGTPHVEYVPVERR